MPSAARLIPMLLLPVAAAAAFLYWQAPAPPPQSAQVRPVPVRTVQVTRSDISELTRAVGHVRASSHVVIRPQVDGQLIELNVREGQQVRRGDLLARIDDRSITASLERASAELAMARASLSAARQDLARYLTLSQRQAVSAQVIDQNRTLVEQLVAQVQAEEAKVETERVRLSHTRLHAPTDGVVGLREVDEGNYVRTSDANGLFSISRIHPITVEMALPQSQLPTLRALLSNPERVPVRAFTHDGGELLGEGRLVAIDNRVGNDTGTIRVRAEFDNQAGSLWPGQFVAVTLQSGLRRDALSLPHTAMQRGLDGPFVYRVRDGKAERVSVALLYERDGIAVISGVEAGDEVVFDGQSRLQQGSAVSPTAIPAIPSRTSTANTSANRS
jgi:RND family efflux transporter MFP subunit